MSDDFERFIVERFLEFYNNANNKRFKIVEKRDETIRDKLSYDYHCSDIRSGGDMAIEVKRLVPEETRFKANIENWFRKYITDAIDFQFDGTYFLVLGLYELRQADFRNKRKREAFFANLKKKIFLNRNKNEFIELSSSPKIGLGKFSKEGNDLFLWLINFASADENEIARILEKSLDKFSEDSDLHHINVILLLESGSMCRGRDIVDVIENLAEEHDFTAISEIYNLAIWKETSIARVYPTNKFMGSIFFVPEDHYEKAEFLKKCIGYFK